MRIGSCSALHNAPSIYVKEYQWIKLGGVGGAFPAQPGHTRELSQALHLIGFTCFRKHCHTFQCKSGSGDRPSINNFSE